MIVPEPDDLGKEITYDLGWNSGSVYGGYFNFSPGALFVVDADTPKYFEEDGILYETFPMPEGGYYYYF